MKKKFDIIKYTELIIKEYKDGYSSRNDTIDMLLILLKINLGNYGVKIKKLILGVKLRDLI